MEIPFYAADVFTQQVFNGAQIAVIPDAEVLTDQQMQSIAEELNLWSSVFISKDKETDNGFSLRLFTPTQEINFGSHTTIAAAHILATIGQVELDGKHTPITFKTKSGIINAHITRQADGELLSTFTLSTEPIVDNYAPSNDELANLLRLERNAIGIKNFHTRLVSNQGIYIVVPVYKFEDVRRAMFDRKQWYQSTAPNTLAEQILLFSQQTETPGADFHLRLIGQDPDQGEDPPIGSAMPAFAAYLCAHSHIKQGTYSFIAERGLQSKRQSLLHVEIDNKPSKNLTLRVGGNAKLVCEGKLHL